MGIVYKYYGYQAGMSAIKEMKLGFRDAREFNDIFEMREWQKTIIDKHESLSFFKTLQEYTGILSLTRCPLNELMWSHYAEDHKGFVIGYDENDPILSQNNIINIQSGDVKYHGYFNANVDRDTYHKAITKALYHTKADISEMEFEAIKNLFLLKRKEWEYEKEVRVVRLINSPFSDCYEWQSQVGRNYTVLIQPLKSNVNILKVSGLYLFPVEYISIKEIYIGARNPILNAKNYTGSINSKLENKETKIYTISTDGDNDSLRANLKDNTFSLREPEEWLKSRVYLKENELKSLLQRDDIIQRPEDLIISSFSSGEISITRKSELR